MAAPEPALSHKALRTHAPPISWLMAKALANPGIISLAAGFVDEESLPVEAVRRIAAELLANETEARKALQYGTTAGHEPLRRRILERVARQDGVRPETLAPSLDRVVVTGGSQQLLYLLCEALLDPGDIVLLADPTYFVFMGCLSSAGAVPLGVAADGEGMIPAALEARLESLKADGRIARVKAVYVVSYFENPTGTSVGARRRPALLGLVERFSEGRKIYLIEDAAYRDLRYEGEDLPTIKSLDQRGHVALAFTFSKPFSPGLKTGAGILPAELVAPILNLKGNHDFGSPNFNQFLLERALASGAFDAQVARLRETYRRKRDVLLAALRTEMPEGVAWSPPAGGLYVWATLPDGIDSGPKGPFFQAALDRGILYVPGEYCYCREDGVAKPANGLRLSFGMATEAEIREGVRRLAAAVSLC